MWIEEIIARHENWQRIYCISIGAQPTRGGSASLQVRRKAKNLILKMLRNVTSGVALARVFTIVSATRNEQKVCNFKRPQSLLAMSTDLEDLDWIHVNQDRVHRWILVNRALKLWILKHVSEGGGIS
jgi:hypothetical protein